MILLGLPQMHLNCMVKFGESNWMPAIHVVSSGFYDIKGHKLATPTEYKSMTALQIHQELVEKSRVFIGG